GRQGVGERGVAVRVVELRVRPVADPRLVGQELPRRDRPGLLGERGHVALDGRVEVEARLLRELQGQGGGDGLGHGGQAVHGGGGGGDVVRPVGHAEAGRPPQLALAYDGGGEAGHPEPLHGGHDGGLYGRAARGRQGGDAGRHGGRGAGRRR